MTEVENKLDLIRAQMKNQSLTGVYLRGVDWFSWITAGGTSSVLLASETGVAEVLVTSENAFLLTNRIERARLCDEELSGDFEIVESPWQKTDAHLKFVRRHGGLRVACDRGDKNYVSIPFDLTRARWTLNSEEILRYQEIGRLAQAAMQEALKQAEPEWTETEFAGVGARALLTRGLEPALVLAAGTARAQMYRHPIPKAAPLGQSAMLVFCARGHGLYANLTRFRFFDEPSAETTDKFAKLKEIESAALRAATPGANLAEVYLELERAYRNAGFDEEIHNHHQGGITGYLARERLVTPGDQETVSENMALAFNPSLPGAKREDTIIVTASGFTNLTGAGE